MEFWMGIFLRFRFPQNAASNSRMYPDLCLLNIFFWSADFILFHPRFQPTALTQTDWSDAKHRSLNSTNPLFFRGSRSHNSSLAECTQWLNIQYKADLSYIHYTSRVQCVFFCCPASELSLSLLFVLAETNSCTLNVESAPKKLFLHSIYIHSVKLRVWFVGEELSVNTASISLHEFQGASRQGLHQIPLMCLPNRFQRCSYWVKGCN